MYKPLQILKSPFGEVTIKYVCMPPKLVTQKTLRQIAPPNISPPGGLYLKIALKYKVKQSKNGKFPSNYKASLIDFETQLSLRR